MPKRKDLTGVVFGELTVLGFSHSYVQPSGQKRAVWKVQCSCGVVKECSTSNLLSKSTVSCGHVGAENRRKSRVVENSGAAKNYLYISYKKRAEYRNLPFLLCVEKFIELTEGNCVYCGNAPSNIRKGRGSAGSYVYNGIDRIDNAKGYFEGNVVSCCGICNQMKMDMMYKDFMSHIKRIYENAT